MTSIRDALSRSGLPRLEARMLLTAVSGLSRLYLIAHDDALLADDVAARFEALCVRRRAGEPVAYLLGEREFYGRRFGVTPDVLIPRPDTELLVELALAHGDRTVPLRVADLGCGSGAIAVTLALEAPAWQLYAVDVSAAALAVAQANAAQLGARVDFRLGSWFEPLVGAPAFDLLVSNPPYIHRLDHHLGEGDVRFEPRGALTDEDDGLSCLREIAATAPRHLRVGGWLLVEHGFDQGEACRQLFDAAGFVQVATLQDLAGNDRVTLGCVSPA